MVSPKPVRSRTALNALRGLVLTTSCSVVLLAEERRRRTKIARTAIDNARKLHTVKGQHRPLSMLDARIPDADYELVTLDRPTNVPRRRRQQRPPSQSLDGVNRAKEAEVTTQHLQSEEPPHPKVAPTSLRVDHNHTSSRKVDSRVAVSSDAKPSAPTIDPSLLLRPKGLGEQWISPDLFDISSDRGPEQPPIAEDSIVVYSNDEFATRQDTPSPSFSLRELGEQWSTSDFFVDHDVRAPEEFPSPSTILNTLEGVQDPDEVAADPNHLIIDLLNYFSSPILHDPRGHPRLSRAIRILNCLLEKIETFAVFDLDAVAYKDLAVDVIRKAKSQGVPHHGFGSTKRNMRCSGRRLLRVIATIDHANLPAAMDALMPFHTSVDHLVVPLLNELVEKKNSAAIQTVLRYLSTSAPAGYVLNFSSILQLLDSHSSRYEDIHGARRIYEALVEAGLSDLINIPPTADYDIHSLFLRKAVTTWAETLCVEEAKAIREMNPEAGSDPELRFALAIADGIDGRPHEVGDVLAMLDEDSKSTDPTSCIMTTRVLDLYLDHLPAAELERILRAYVSNHQLRTRGNWIMVVLNHHSRQVDYESTLSWLTFVFGSGYQPTEGFIQGIYHTLRSHWTIADDAFYWFYRVLRDAAPGVPYPTFLRTARGRKIAGESTAHFPIQSHDWESWYIAHSDRFCLPKSTEKETCLKMQKDAQRGDWQEVWDSYENLPDGAKSSLGCLRLAVLARLKLDEGAPEMASKLVEDAHRQGSDVSDVLTPLLLAQFAQGVDSTTLVRDTLGRGLRIDDMVFNAAAQSASSSRNSRGTVEICESAASHNGGGNLLYSPYNFVNLIVAYNAMKDYKRLAPTLKEYMDIRQSWAGGKTCKQTLKWIMRTVAKRVTEDEEGREKHEEMLSLVNEAYQHVFISRFHPTQTQSLIESIAKHCQRTQGPLKGMKSQTDDSVTAQNSGMTSESVPSSKEYQSRGRPLRMRPGGKKRATFVKYMRD